MIFLDTSAIYALADAGDPNHDLAAARFAQALEVGEALLTHNYILVESLALVRQRLGPGAARHLADDTRAFEVEWVDEETHEEAVRHLEQAGRRTVSLVDAVSYVVMRRRGVRIALAFDEGFVAEGFRLYGVE